MAKTIRKMFSILFGALALLCAGFFFTACGVDYEKIELEADVSYIELEVGEEKEISFHIKNYAAGFSNIISISERTSGANVGDQASIFECSSIKYVSDSSIKVKITGKNGGEGTLYAKTYEGGKECSIGIRVKQYTSTLEVSSSLMYVTNGSYFTPNSNMFVFDSHTTQKDLTHYFFTTREQFNFNTYYLSSINEEQGRVVFTDGIGGSAEGDIVKFDSATLSNNNKIVLYQNGEVTEEKAFQDDFFMLSVYDYSVGNDKYDKILYTISDVYVLPSLNISVTGGYFVNDSVETYEELNDNDVITIVPNNSKMNTYIIRLEVENTVSESPINIEKIVDGNDYLDIDVFNGFDSAGDGNSLVYYWKVSQNIQSQSRTNFGFKVFYDVAQDLDVENVNCQVDLVGKIEIAPTDIKINGTTEPDDIVLYNHYGSDAYGWQELAIGVISGYPVSPSYDGIYFEYDTSLLEIMHNHVPVSSGDSVLYSDLTQPFMVKGKRGVDETETQIKIHLLSEYLQEGDELVKELSCDIVSGATYIERQERYQSEAEEDYKYFHIDIDGGAQPFNEVLYANKKFQGITYQSIGLYDTVEIIVDESEPYIQRDSMFFLNLQVRPKAVGKGEYQIYLDNGIFQKVKFDVIRTLKPETTSVRLADQGNGSVTNISYGRKTVDSLFDDVVSLEVLNASDSSRITFGSAANIVINANASVIEPTTDNDGIVVTKVSTPSSSSTGYRITTARNGESVATFLLRGSVVDDFKEDKSAEELIYIYTSSYSLINEFSFKNGENFANENIVYFGENAGTEDKNITFTIVAKNEESTNFYRYNISGELVKLLYTDESIVDVDYDEGYSYKVAKESVGEPTLVREKFGNKFVYYYAQRQNGRSIETYTNVTVLKDGDESTAKTVKLQFTDGLMFMGTSFDHIETDEYGEETSRYTVRFSNMYSIGANYGTFNLETMTYVVSDAARESSILVIRAFIKQRNLTLPYNITIRPTAYIPVDSITLASSISKINFSNSKLEVNIGVYTYPTYSTNKKISVDIIRTNVDLSSADTYSDLLEYEIDDSNSSNGVYTVRLSCANFFAKHISDIETITAALTGVVYIYPQEWGKSYSSIAKYEPIKIDFQYRNGSKTNPYMIESADDVVDMNSNNVKLKSHYEISSVVDMSSIKNFVPIGVLNGEVVGFSGSIIGTSAQAAITNIVVSNTNFIAEVDSKNYAGLFAKINSNATIENVSFAGRFKIETALETNAEIGLVAAENAGFIINCEARIDASTINVGEVSAEIGGLVGRNSGKIYQDFYKYNGVENPAAWTGDYVPGYKYINLGVPPEEQKDSIGYYQIVNNAKVYVDSLGYRIDSNGKRVVADSENEILYSGWNYSGQSTKNVAYFTGKLNVVVNNSIVSVGGVAGYTNGVIERFTKNTFKLYGYSAYTAFTLINVSGSSSNASKSAFVGGIAGDVATSSNTIIRSTLVGGEIDTRETVRLVDTIGGILGRTKEGNIAIWNNTARVFLRGRTNVGGIVGKEEYSQAESVLVSWVDSTDPTKLNTVEAVDDGRTAYDAALIIKTVYAERVERVAHPFAVGTTTRNYTIDVKFAVFTYVTRTFLEDVEPNINNLSTANYYGDYICYDGYDGDHFETAKFTQKNADVSFDGNNKMKTDGESTANVFFMYYFGVDGALTSDGSETAKTQAQEEISELNFVNSQSTWYPFTISSQDVSISTRDETIVSIDSNGNISIKNIGLATISLTSILNVNRVEKVYVYVVNFFNKDVSASIFYTSQTASGERIGDDSIVYIYGNSSTNAYVVPDYQLAETKSINDKAYSITDRGILTFANVKYALTKNSFVTATYHKTVDNNISNVQINKQTVVFRKTSNSNVDEIDRYFLEPMLKVDVYIDGQNYSFYYVFNSNNYTRLNMTYAEFENSQVYYKYVDGQYVEQEGLTEFAAGEQYYVRDAKSGSKMIVKYRETATSIRVNYKSNAIKTNNPFSDYLIVNSTDPNEHIFYQIFRNYENGNTELVQERMPSSYADIENYYTGTDTDKMNITEDDLFNFVIKKDAINGSKFNYSCSVNVDSEAFKNRFNVPIYGDYIVYLYANELEAGVSDYFRLRLDEASVNYIVANNYSNAKDISISNSVIVPSQNGMIEVSVDPIEAIFDRFTISNNAINWRKGAGVSNFTFVYEKNDVGAVSYKYVEGFGTLSNGSLSFTYKEMINLFERLGADVEYKGKVYIGYLMPSNDVEDGSQVQFDIDVTYGQNEMVSTSVSMVTKLNSYAKLSFVNRVSTDDSYYVARGVSYGLKLDYYGFKEEDITITTTNGSVANISGSNGRYVLNITSGIINYNETDPGFKVEVHTVASKVVDNVLISTSQTLTIYVMEYVFNYSYVEGVNEDIVSGMSKGVIENAIGNPYELSIDVRKFIEYDKSNPTIVDEVTSFLANLLEGENSLKFKVHYDGAERELGKDVEMRTDYYSIKSYTVIPLKLYNASSDIYHFSVEGGYAMYRGQYRAVNDGHIIYSEFSFNVHDQSTEDSPIPVETYSELMSMIEGEWYILTKDIVLPNDEDIAGGLIEAFTPITTRVAGFDGNGHNIVISGIYTFENLANVGLFASVSEGMLIKNVTIVVANDTVVRFTVPTFNFGAIVAENEGIITNCEVKSSGTSVLSVVSTVEQEASYVAGIAASNTGNITNSRVCANIMTNANLAGLVGQNNGVIASSYFKGASLENRTGSVREYVAGIAISNSGKIYTSYVSGDTVMSSGKMYYDGTTNVIVSTNNLAGFVYTNTGEVYDCYSNIKIESGAYATGFVFENSGTIERCFSTSVLTNSQTSNYGFAYRNTASSGAGRGTIEDCYYLSDPANNINVSIGVIADVDGLKALTCDEFADVTNNFKNYVKTSERRTNSVWFMSRTETNNDSTFNGSKFNVNRLELVAPNIVATSMKQLDRIETVVDEETGAVYANYIYVYVAGKPALGTVYNPIVISDHKTMESYIKNTNNAANFNHSYYRIVCDIDYSDATAGSELYKTIFAGYIEGNFMKISGITLMSNDSVSSAGLFGEISSEGSSSDLGTIMNLTVEPKIVSFASAKCVGTIAGKVNGGTFVNLNVVVENDQLVATGNNLVGGVFGCAVGQYTMINVYSDVGAKARRQNVSNDDHPNQFSDTLLDLENYSFAGSLVGALGGNGTVYNVKYERSELSVFGDKAGIFFGYVGENVNVENVLLRMSSSMIVNAYTYGGLIVGESKGTLKNITVNGSGADFTNFKRVPFIPQAIGGIAGLVSGGDIDNVYMGQSIVVASQSDDIGVTDLGGIAGRIVGGATLRNITVVSKLVGFINVGGIAGEIVQTSGNTNFVDIYNFTVYLSSVEISGRNLTAIAFGGAIGKVSEGVTLRMTDGTNVEVKHIEIRTFVYNQDAAVSVGTVIGNANTANAYLITGVSSKIEGGKVSINDMTKDTGLDGVDYSYAASTHSDLIERVQVISGVGNSASCDLRYECTKRNTEDDTNDNLYTFVVCVCDDLS